MRPIGRASNPGTDFAMCSLHLPAAPKLHHAHHLHIIGPALSRRSSPHRWRNFVLSLISNQGRTIALRTDTRPHHWSGDPPLLSGMSSSTSWHDISGAIFLVLRMVKMNYICHAKIRVESWPTTFAARYGRRQTMLSGQLGMRPASWRQLTAGEGPVCRINESRVQMVHLLCQSFRDFPSRLAWPTSRCRLQRRLRIRSGGYSRVLTIEEHET
jgi:hypothetical protein